MTTTKAGFTLIELLITLAIIGILATIAYPVYTDQVRKARRTDAKSVLLQAANRQERYYTGHHAYAENIKTLYPPDGTLPTDTKYYTVSASPRNGDDQTFEIKATATEDQTNDDCRTFTINELGQKKATGKDGSSVDNCW